MDEMSQWLESLSRQPSLQVSPEQRPAIVANILHHLMYPYFLTRTPEMQEKLGERQYQAFMQALADYCLRGYVENPEPRLTIAFIQGLHRQFYANAPSVPVKTMDGSMTSMVPGEFKTTRVLIRRHNVPGEWFDTTAPEDVTRDIERLLELIHDERIPIFERYIRLIVDLIHIHPFPDSNGKVAMLLGDLLLLKHGIHPPYYAKYKQENKALVYGRQNAYFLYSQRDVSIFYPLLVEAYAGCGLALPPTALPATGLPAQALERLLAETRAAIAAGDLPVGCVLTVGDSVLSSHRNTVRTFDEAIEASLRPRLLDTLGKRPAHEHELLISNFRGHVRLLSGYLREELENDRFSVNTAIGFHIRLYPPGCLLRAADDDGNPVIVSPGAWRKREIRDEPFRDLRWRSVCSPLSYLERDLEHAFFTLNAISNPRREDILRFFFQFLRVHPFADSNGTTASVLADALCVHHGLAPFLVQNIRRKDKAFAWSLCEAYDIDQSEQALTNLLGKFDAFNQLFPIQGLPA